MAIRHQLSFGGKAFHGFAFELGGVAVNVVEDLGLEHEKGAVDPAFAGLGFFRKFGDLVAFEDHVSEARRRPDGGDGGELSMGAVEAKKRVEVDVRHAVAPGEHECLIAQMRLEAFDAAAGEGAVAGVDEIDGPIGLCVAVAKDVEIGRAHV